jgi:hypothetical protein
MAQRGSTTGPRERLVANEIQKLFRCGSNARILVDPLDRLVPSAIPAGSL